MKHLAILVAAVLGANTFGLEQWRYFYGYADQQMVDLARSSGADPLAVIGKEIPSNTPLHVPKTGGHFKVRFFQQFLGGGPQQRGYSRGPEVMLVFDRAAAWASALSNQQLDGSSFRKVRPRYSFWDSSFGWTNYRDSYSGFGSALAWGNQTTIADINHDGIQDTGTYALTSGSLNNPRSLLQGVSGPGASLRPVGLNGSFELVVGDSGVASYLDIGEAQHVMDVEFTSNLSVGETFGLAPEEPGLQIYCNSTGPYGGDNDLGTTYTSPSVNFDTAERRQYTGARYNLIGAVPEPSGLLVVGLGLLLIRRRSR